MLSKFIGQLAEHIHVLLRNMKPLAIWLMGAIFAYLIFVQMQNLVNIRNSIIQKLLEEPMRKEILKYISWIISLIILWVSWNRGLDEHRRNMNRSTF